MRTLILVIAMLIAVATAAAALEPPELRGRVNDYARMLSADTVAQLENSLAGFERTDSTQIVVLTVPSLDGDSIEDFSIRVAERWKIGMKGKDNGAILVIAAAERKMRIEVGRGLEGKLTDLVSGRIIRTVMGPSFRQGHFDAGVTAGVSAIMAAVKGEFHADSREVKHKKSVSPIFSVAVFLFIACIFLGSVSRFLGGAVGAIGLPAAAWMFLPTVSLIFLVILVLAGFAAGFFVSSLFGSGGGGGGGPWFGGGGPYFGGGFGSGGGGGDSGGFFSGGGGDFGGGGASGDW